MELTRFHFYCQVSALDNRPNSCPFRDKKDFCLSVKFKHDCTALLTLDNTVSVTLLCQHVPRPMRPYVQFTKGLE